MHSALLMRVQDTSLVVLNALYTESVQLLPIISGDPEAYIRTLATLLHSASSTSSPPRPVIRAHLEFLSFHFLPSLASSPSLQTLQQLAFETVFFPFLLPTKSRLKTAIAAWTVLGEHKAEAGLGRYEVVQGCLDTWNWELGKSGTAGKRKKGEGELSVAEMARVGIALAARMAGASVGN
jgi:U3 small nucleolar RNA-associated protein 10